MARRATAIVILLSGLLAAPASSPAAVGDLSFRDCVTSDPTTTGCTDVSATTSSLDGLNEAVEFGAGGKDVYGIGEIGDAVVHLRRNADTGSLVFQDCVTGSPTPSSGCTDVSSTAPALDEVNSLAVAADGRDAYAGAAASGALVHFTRDPASGTLTFADCISSLAVTGCTNVGATTAALKGFESIGVGVGGTSVYVGTNQGPSIVHLSRGGDGKLTFQDCLSDSAVLGCTNVGATTGALDGTPQARFAFSSDGRNIYAVNDGSAVATFNLGASGALTAGGCFSSTGALGCTAAPSGALGQEGLAMSPDSKHVYSTGTSAISRLSRDPTTGALTFLDCITTGAGLAGCTNIDAVNDKLGSAQQLAVSGDGLGAYLVGSSQLVDLRRNPDTGQLTFARCFTAAPSAVPGCTDITSTTNVLEDLQVVAVSPSGTKVYITSANKKAMATFERQLAPSCSNGGTTVVAPAVVTIPLTCSDPNGDTVARSIVAPPAHGTLGPVSGDTVTYSPAPGYNGFDSFTFQATAAGDSSNVATVTIGVARDRIAPLVTNLSATPGTFRAARVTLHQKGTTFRYRLSEVAAVTLSIQRQAAGRRVAKKCVRPTKANRRKPHCKRWVTLGSFGQIGVTGFNTRPFKGRLFGKKLSPGSYRVRGVGRDAAGNRSRAKTAGFKIVKR